jgi:hypothetical protein
VTIDSLTADVFLHSDGGACTTVQSTRVTMRSLDGAYPAATWAKGKDSGWVKFSGGNPRSDIATWTMTPVP